MCKELYDDNNNITIMITMIIYFVDAVHFVLSNYLDLEALIDR